MQPITRKEMYLNRLAGQQAQAIPAEPITREEQYLGRLCGEDVTPPAEAITRIEQYMAFASGERETKPANPLTREEWYWDKYQGGDVPEEKTIAFTDIITVTDALARPAVDLQAEITATQNLNGYEYPWVGGAGKNKLNVNDTLSVELQTDIITNISAGTYTLSYQSTSRTPTGNAFLFQINWGGSNHNVYVYPNNKKTTFTADDTITNIRIYSDADYSQSVGVTTVFNGLMIELGSTATEYAPYENICPISGRTEVNVTRTGKNLLPNTATTQTINGVTFTVNSDGTISLSGTATVNTVFDIPNFSAIGGTAYILNGCPSGGSTSTYLLSIPGVGYDAGNGYNYNPATDATIIVRITIYNGQNTDGLIFKPMIRLATFTDAEYEPYEGDTFNTELGRTVYGGTLDLTTGELTITHAYVDLGDLHWTTSLSLQTPNLFGAYINNKKDGYRNFKTTSYRTVKKIDTMLANGEATGTTITIDEPMTYIFVKDERATTAEEFTTLVTGQKMVYELATPQTISLTPTEVMMLENNNTIWADSGRVQLTYLSKAAQRVQSMNASLKANTLKITKAITGGVEA